MKMIELVDIKNDNHIDFINVEHIASIDLLDTRITINTIGTRVIVYRFDSKEKAKMCYEQLRYIIAGRYNAFAEVVKYGL